MLLRDWMEQERISASELARRLKLTPAAVRWLKLRERAPSLELAQTIIEMTDGAVTVGDLTKATSLENLRTAMRRKPIRRRA